MQHSNMAKKQSKHCVRLFSKGCTSKNEQFFHIINKWRKARPSRLESRRGKISGALGREIVPKPASSRDKRGFGCGWNLENFRTQVQLGRFQREFKLILISFHL